MTLKVVGFVLLFGLCGMAETSPAKPVDCSQLLTWIVGGVPGPRVLRLTRERGLAFRVNEDVASALSQAGEKPDFIRTLHKTQGPDRAKHQDPCPVELTRAATYVAQQRYDQAEPIIRRLLVATPADADLHAALGYILEQRGDLDDAFDAYADAAELNPEFPEIHSGMSYIFSRWNDGNNAVAEARTALSLDPDNAEAYRYLGLALFVSDKYSAARKALEKSLARDPNRGETYYDLGLLEVAENDLRAAAESYRNAIRLSPHLGEAQTSLGAVLRVLGQQGAVAVEQKSKPDAPNPSN
ncbi:MAG TPA: tetratricopeptide repeat protein [Terriglobales bacterium]|nr:tetratricopeptide repeat protein [Terriglobales bacterium]